MTRCVWTRLPRKAQVDVAKRHACHAGGCVDKLCEDKLCEDKLCEDKLCVCGHVVREQVVARLVP